MSKRKREGRGECIRKDRENKELYNWWCYRKKLDMNWKFWISFVYGNIFHGFESNVSLLNELILLINDTVSLILWNQVLTDLLLNGYITFSNNEFLTYQYRCFIFINILYVNVQLWLGFCGIFKVQNQIGLWIFHRIRPLRALII